MVLEVSGNKIMRVLRESKSYTQEYVGDYLGIEQNTYSKLEAGHIRLTTDQVKKLAELYQVAPDYFLSEELQITNNSREGNSEYKTGITALQALYDKIVANKDEQIKALRDDLTATRDQLSALITKLTDKL